MIDPQTSPSAARSTSVQVRLLIRGEVQGVGYRWAAKEQAERLGISGWIRNRPDGTVETVGCGPTALVEAYVEWCKQGPRQARVESVERLEDDERCSVRTFDVIR